MLSRFGRRYQLAIWLLLSSSLSAWWAYVVFHSEDKTALLPGKTSHGHYQIEMECSACHDTRPDGLLVSAVSNEACLKCHEIDLDEADDSHPAIKFKKPENRPFLEKIDARRCVTCHTEHKPDATAPMGLTIPADYCTYCHQSTIEERETHKGLGFETCATAGCHNFHDNRALYERHLALNSTQPPFLPNARVATLDNLKRYLADHPETKALTAQDADAPASIKASPEHIQQWSSDAHATAGVNCTSCHQPDGQPWQDTVAISTCAKCHQDEEEGFLRGKHGMRLASGLTPMNPSMARQPMHAGAAHRTLDCASCHSSHDFDTRHAAHAACMQCHNDEHTRAYENSPHFTAWKRELAGESPSGSGVSCATCHMPRIADGHGGYRVEHNQSANLKPNEKMLRPVCQQCHGLPFAIDALADRNLIDRNFTGKPAIHNESCDWSRQRAIDRKDPEVMELIRKLSASAPSSPENNNTNSQ
jgi:hypothetical protein